MGVFVSGYRILEPNSNSEEKLQMVHDADIEILYTRARSALIDASIESLEPSSS